MVDASPVNHLSNITPSTPEDAARRSAKQKIKLYFSRCKKSAQSPTKAGLARLFSCYTWKAFEEKCDAESPISHDLKIARVKLREWWETRLGSDKCTAGVIFWHKNDGWKDVQEIKMDENQVKSIDQAQQAAMRQCAEQLLLSHSVPIDTQPVGGIVQSITDAELVKREDDCASPVVAST
jgi:hypothetical protein